MTDENPSQPNTSTQIDSSRFDKIIGIASLWSARIVLAVLAAAGTLHLLGGVDAVIAWPVTVVLVGLLVKETL